ncbi:MAG: hydrogenase 4 subunit B [Actinomycetia bacterium]|nr:hydrogenase 4 subunit B [Actinomycetes bacterium]
MTTVEAGLLLQPALAGVAVVAAFVVPARSRSVVVGSLAAALGVAGVVTGLAAMGGAGGSVELPVALPPGLPLEPLLLAPDRLGGVFLAVAGGVGALAALYGVGYASGPAASRTGWTAFVLFLLGMQWVPVAADAMSFLLAWELMAIASTVLLLAEHRHRAEVRSAALWYAVMTHLSFLLLLVGFAVLAAAAGGTGFDTLAAARIDGSAAGVAFVLLAAGFGAKAGLVPLHVWLPRAHPEAPSHVSAAMSAAMVKMGVYGLLLVVLRLLPEGPRWWALVLLVLGTASALYGILQASVTSDLKRLLAYSTTENAGLMVTALAVALLLAAAGQRQVADVALTAVLLLVVSHAAFKTVLFLGAGSVLRATGERDLDRLGGLGRTMPTTAATFGVAALGAAALPVTSGFVAEWVLLQSLIHGDGRSDRLLAVTLPITVAVVALTAGLALLTFVKAYGIAFSARPRSESAALAQEAAPSMRAAVLLGTAAVLALGLLPGPVADRLAAAVGARGIEPVGLFGLDLPAVDALLDPVALVLLAGAVALPLAVVGLRAAARRPRRDVELAWGCGGVRVSPRMQYTATSYAEPLVRVFDDALRPSRDLQVSHAEESRYLVQRVEFRQQLSDVVEDRAYLPAARRLGRVGVLARRVQNGSIHRYLAFSFAALVVVLLVVTW